MRLKAPPQTSRVVHQPPHNDHIRSDRQNKAPDKPEKPLPHLISENRGSAPEAEHKAVNATATQEQKQTTRKQFDIADPGRNAIKKADEITTENILERIDDCSTWFNHQLGSSCVVEPAVSREEDAERSPNSADSFSELHTMLEQLN